MSQALPLKTFSDVTTDSNRQGDLPRETKLEKTHARASLVAQWLRVCLPMQVMRVCALVWDDPICCGASGPVSHNY